MCFNIIFTSLPRVVICCASCIDAATQYHSHNNNNSCSGHATVNGQRWQTVLQTMVAPCCGYPISAVYKCNQRHWARSDIVKGTDSLQCMLVWTWSTCCVAIAATSVLVVVFITPIPAFLHNFYVSLVYWLCLIISFYTFIPSSYCLDCC